MRRRRPDRLPRPAASIADMSRGRVVGRLGWVVVGAAAGLLLLTVAVVVQFGPVVRFDAVVSAAAYRAALAHPGWRSVMGAVTWTANTTTVVPVAAVLILLLVWRGRWRQGCFAVAAMVATHVVRLLILDSVDRPRPVGGLAAASGWAFPSGHTTASATAALVTVIVCWPLLRARWARVLLAGVAAGWALAVGVSRVALVVHWPSDIVGAWLLVAVIVPSTFMVLRVLLGSRRSPDPAAVSGR